jgi:hypothetical protein
MGKLPIPTDATTNQGKWASTATVAVVGNYDVWGEMTTFDANSKIHVTKTTVVNLNVKWNTFTGSLHL